MLDTPALLQDSLLKDAEKPLGPVERFVSLYYESMADALAGTIFLRSRCGYSTSNLERFAGREHSKLIFYMYGKMICLACVRDFLEDQYNNDVHFLAWKFPTREDAKRIAAGIGPYDRDCELCLSKRALPHDKRVHFFRRCEAHWTCLWIAFRADLEKMLL